MKPQAPTKKAAAALVDLAREKHAQALIDFGANDERYRAKAEAARSSKRWGPPRPNETERTT